MLYELREYDVAPGRMTALNDRFRDVAIGYFNKHGIEVIGFWTDLVGRNNRLTYLLRYRDMAHRETAWRAFLEDPGRLAEFAPTEANGPLVLGITNRLLSPTEYSPLI